MRANVPFNHSRVRVPSRVHGRLVECVRKNMRVRKHQALSDAASVLGPELPDFREHRHDQVRRLGRGLARTRNTLQAEPTGTLSRWASGYACKCTLWHAR